MIPVVVLAAGAASRFGAPKQRLLLPSVLAAVRASSAGEPVVVLGAHEVETDARVVRCSDWSTGPGASLRCGLAALPAGAGAAVVVLADGPDLAPAAIDRLVARWRASGGDLYAATYGGERSHPVVIARRLWDAVPDAGMRAMEAELVPCDDLGSPGDVDRTADLPARFRPDDRAS